jgi:4-hydroxybenzoate polyprenyltransferase
MTTALAPTESIWRQYWVLTKPRVTQLAVFCAVIGMFLATPGLPDFTVVVAATIGIWLLAAAAFAMNCLIEQQIDARMTRTAQRATAQGAIASHHVFAMSSLLGGAGMFVLYNWVNALTMWLTFATFVGYAVVYTMVLKPRTSQNIVIGGLSGAMPPALGVSTHYFCVDTPPLLGPSTLPQQRLREIRLTDVARYARSAIHTLAYFALQHCLAGNYHFAVCHAHERLVIPRFSMVVGWLVYLVSVEVIQKL